MRPVLLILIACAVTSPAFAADDTLTFEQDIWPIFRAHCFDCHGAAAELKGQLDLRLVRFQLKGGDSGPALTAGDPAGSYLLDRIESGEMPPGEAKVTPKEKDILRRWIAAGAKTARAEPTELAPGLGITPEERRYWAFQPIQRPQTPTVKAVDRVVTPIDALVLQKLEAHNLTMAPPADKTTLVRRAYFDLIGLPPTFEQVQAFVNDPSPGAWERLIDDLLQSPHYGERWGRHWLDVAGYADSDGASNDDPVRPYAYKYRDYVIKSLNADKPFDQFLIEQLAGDELVPLPHANLTPEQIEKLVATGFLRMAVDGTNSGGIDPAMASNQNIADTIKIVTTSLYGLSVGCAQCHDHRYDPIPQADYYGLRSILEPALDANHWRNPRQRVVSLFTDADRAKSAEIENEAKPVIAERDEKQQKYIDDAFTKELEKHPEELRDPLRRAFYTAADKRTPEQQTLLKERPSANINPGVLYQYDAAAAEELKKLGEKIEEIRRKKPVEDYISPLNELPNVAPVAKLFYRGDYRQPQAEIAPADLQIASTADARKSFAVDDAELPTSGRRLAWAKWLTSGQHPLVGRVLANRIWMHHFGRGIVSTPSEFGKLGELPTHPELLDWLASEFASNGWSLKKLHKTIMLSSVYQQSSRRTPEQDAVDSDNRLYGRMSVKRLEAEAIRDRLLTVSGVLDRTPFGPPVAIAPDDAGQIVVTNDVPRRSVYLQVRRTQPVAMLTAFDAPVMDVNCERRPSSTVAGQSLMLMNSQHVLKSARQLAERIRKETTADTSITVPAELSQRLQLAQSPWSYGMGGFDTETNRVVKFVPLPHWTGSIWQGGPILPDPAIGYTLLHTNGGHTGDNPDHATVRRFTAPISGTLSIRGSLQHPSENGDGVRGRVVSSRAGLLGSWTVKTISVDTVVSSAMIEAGDTLDFIVDCNENVTSDSFTWTVVIELKDATGAVLRSWDSAAGFRGPTTAGLPQQIVSAWRMAYGREITPMELSRAVTFAAEQLAVLQTLSADAKKTNPPADDELLMLTNLCQQLLGSNEFLYVD